MIHGICSLIYPVKDLAKSKEFYSKLLDVKPNYADQYYVGFQVGGKESDFTYQEIGLSPSGHTDGATGAAPYLRVEDIKESLKECLAAGATLSEDIHDIGHNVLMASVADLDGNAIGLIQFAPSNSSKEEDKV